jgi:hypothetical protein
MKIRLTSSVNGRVTRWLAGPRRDRRDCHDGRDSDADHNHDGNLDKHRRAGPPVRTEIAARAVILVPTTTMAAISAQNS